VERESEGEIEVLKESPTQWHFVHHVSHMIWPGISAWAMIWSHSDQLLISVLLPQYFGTHTLFISVLLLGKFKDKYFCPNLEIFSPIDCNLWTG
jgi:hypothetical protein